MGLIIQLKLQGRLKVLATVINAKDGNLFGINGKGNDGSLAIVGDTQTRAYVVAQSAPKGERTQLFAMVHDGVGIALGNLWRSCRGNVVIERCQLLQGFRCKRDGVRHQDLVMAS